MAAAIPILSLVVSGVSTYVSYQGQKDANEDVKRARDMETAALEREAITEEAAARVRLKKLLSSQRALYAKAGVDLSTGSPLTILSDTETRGEKELVNIRKGYKEAANITRFQSTAEYRAGRTRAAGTLLSGLASTAGSAYRFQQAGTFD